MAGGRHANDRRSWVARTGASFTCQRSPSVRGSDNSHHASAIDTRNGGSGCLVCPHNFGGPTPGPRATTCWVALLGKEPRVLKVDRVKRSPHNFGAGSPKHGPTKTN